MVFPFFLSFTVFGFLCIYEIFKVKSPEQQKLLSPTENTAPEMPC